MRRYITGEDRNQLELQPMCLDEVSVFEQERNRLHDALLQWMSDTRDPFRGNY